MTDAEINNALNSLQSQITSLSGQLSTETHSLALQITDANDDITGVTAKINLLKAEDIDIHEEIHDVSLEVDNHESRINALELEENTYTGRFNTLTNTDTTLSENITQLGDEIHETIHDLSLQLDSQTSRVNTLEVNAEDYDSRFNSLGNYDTYLLSEIEAMDAEHHEELHELSQALDVHTSKLDDLEEFMNGSPNHVVLSESAYESLPNKVYSTFYFTYEED